MKDGIKQIIGKTISAAVLAENKGRDPKLQVFLEFDDGTHFEFYGSQFNAGGGVNRSGFGAIAGYVARSGGEVTVQYRALPDEPPIAMQHTKAKLFAVDLSTLLWIAYWIGNLSTFAKLTFFGGYRYDGWNWLIAVAVNEFLASIWPLYWAIIRPIFGV